MAHIFPVYTLVLKIMGIQQVESLIIRFFSTTLAELQLYEFIEIASCFNT